MGSVKCIGSEFYGSNNLSAPASSFKLFSSLKSLTLGNMSNLEQWSDPHDHSLQGLEACVKLESLTIVDCVSIRFEHLCFPAASLRFLTNKLSSYINELDVVDYKDFPWPRECTTFPVLETLILRGTEKMESLMPVELYLPNLIRLELSTFGEMKAIPDWLYYNSQSLKYVDVFSCHKLAHFPSRAALQRLRYPCDLRFYDSPIMKEMCTEGSPHSGPVYLIPDGLTTKLWVY
ncbi:hypothetical protein M9H77_28633 [Catharanthus roseus]|uniref:Uncharacterized protein n=1 Tax=Catharanthus roseus TaxID=4058 RepID=A0ACC0AHV0_CATRO|nr:hypothetical protein M9H77_28633 [Catharanthus roseus]